MNEEEKKRLSDDSVPASEVDDGDKNANAELSTATSSEDGEQESVANEPESQASDESEMDSTPQAQPTAEAAVSDNGDESENGPEAQQQQPTEKMLTQSQVNELVGRARQEGRESALKELYGRYGVSDDTELNDVFGRGQAYVTLDDDFKVQQSNNKALLAENALLKTKVDESRWEDIKAILGSKNLDITPENIEAEIPTHPEWRMASAAAIPQGGGNSVNVAQDSQQPQAVLRKLGSESTPNGDGSEEEEEQERAFRLFGFNK